MKSKILIYLGLLLIVLSLIFIVKDKIIEYEIGIKTDKIIENINNKNYEINEEMKTINIDGYDYIGTITIPAINLNLPVLNSWDYNRLNIAPCLYYGSVYDNMIICGHSYKKHFKYLNHLKQGDYIIFTDVLDNNYIYEVKEIQILSSLDVDEMINNDFDLTLYTCTSDGLNRVTIRCNKVNR